MKITLLDGNTPISISPEQRDIMKKIVTEILEKLIFTYISDDISTIRFHLKGDVLETTSLFICVLLHSKESIDILNVMENKLLKTETQDSPGLSFMKFYQSGLYSGNSEINFWYIFSKEESIQWNSTNPYGFTM